MTCGVIFWTLSFYLPHPSLSPYYAFAIVFSRVCFPGDTFSVYTSCQVVLMYEVTCIHVN